MAPLQRSGRSWGVHLHPAEEIKASLACCMAATVLLLMVRWLLFSLKALEVCISFDSKAHSFFHFSFSTVIKLIFSGVFLKTSVFDSLLGSTSFDNMKARNAFLCVGLCNLSTANASTPGSCTFTFLNNCLNGFLFSQFSITLIVIKKAFCFRNWEDLLYSLDIKFPFALLLLVKLDYCVVYRRTSTFWHTPRCRQWNISPQ